MENEENPLKIVWGEQPGRGLDANITLPFFSNPVYIFSLH